ncbi:hydrogenase expression protein HypF [Actinacidiphila sp. bgisy160]|uniref:hydrogenase expression protein HypF n=1 Tax=Actinacidiphila sp. bgisy160 TaxID=3413796 RepID=UPI003D72D785
MRGDEVQPASGVAAGSGTRERTGPRHAAPRKSLLTKLQMPAGKAIALAAMPTAVLMGMGLTPRLASADELPKNPFSGTKCVEQPDEPSESATSSVTPSSGGTKTPVQAPSGSPSSHDSSSGSAGSGDEGGKGGESGGGSAGSAGGSGTTAPAPSASPSVTEQSNLLDPLGVGDALGDLLGLNKASTDSAAATPSATATPAPGATSAAPKPGASTGTVKEKTEDTTEALKKTVSEAAEKLSQTTGKVADSPAPSTPATSADGKTPFPCPTHDAQALADAAYQETQSLLPDDPWVLHSSLLTLTGLDYKGIVEVKTWSGKVKKVLKFTATGVDIKDLQQEVVGPNGTVGHVDARKGSTSTIRNGTVTMYTESLKGNLFGLIPIEFTPDTPPPVNVPAAFFTNVTVEQAGQFGGTLKVPGMHVYNTAD